MADWFDEHKPAEKATGDWFATHAPAAKPSSTPTKAAKPGTRFDAIGEIGEGVIAGALSTMYHGGDLIRRLTGSKRIIDTPEVQKVTTPPNTTAGKVGFYGEQAAEYLIPGGAEEKVVAAAPKGLKLLARAGASAVGTGAITAAQTGDPKAGLAAGAVGGGTTLALGVLGPVIASAGRKIQASTIRPRLADVRDGFKWDVLDRFHLKGNLEQSLNQVYTELTRLRTARNALVAPGSANVDLGKVFVEAEKEIASEVSSLKYAGQGKKVKEALEAIKADVAESLGGSITPVDIREAENAKEHFGMMGAWAYGRPEPDSKVTELVADKVYLKLKSAIEQSLGSTGPEVKALNKQMQELIPVKHAMLARLPVEERNRLFSLTDIAAMIPAIVTGDMRMLGLEGLTRAQKSLRFGNWLTRNAPGITGGTTGRVAGGATGIALGKTLPQ